MSDTHLRQVLQPQLDDLQARGLYKRERQLEGPAKVLLIKLVARLVLNECIE